MIALLRWWRRRNCAHYFEPIWEALDVYAFEVDKPEPNLYVAWHDKEWLCVRGCGKRKIMRGDKIPWSHLAPGEAILGDRLYGPTIPREKPMVLA